MPFENYLGPSEVEDLGHLISVEESFKTRFCVLCRNGVKDIYISGVFS